MKAVKPSRACRKAYLPLIFIIASLLLAGCGSDLIEPPPNNKQPDRCPRISRVIQTQMTDDELLDLIQKQTLKYFYDFAEPNSGMARERNTSGNLVTSGGTGFGIMAMIAGVHRGFLTRQQVLDRITKISLFLKDADRFRGAWPHWMDGRTGRTIPFSSRDDGGDLVETAFLIQGLLTAREYFDGANAAEISLRNLIDTLYYGVNWQWYTQGQNVLYWHWSPNHNFSMNMRISGWNESLIVYVLAAASPTYPVQPAVYHQGWARNGNMVNNRFFYNLRLPLGPDFGGPLFFAHYSFLGLDPRGLKDQYADYWEQNRNHSLINHRYAVANPNDFCHYGDSIWGITASDDPEVGYQAHAPFNISGKDNGTISPTAAISSIPYTPEESMKAIRKFYFYLHNDLWGEFGFKDAFNFEHNWFANSYLAIDQGPIVVMIENHRSGLLWDTFMKNNLVHKGLEKLGFTYE